MTQAHSQVFSFFGENIFFGGNVFVFFICLKHIFLGTTKYVVKCPPVATGLGRGTKKVENHWSTGLISRVRSNYSNVRAKNELQ